MAVLRKELLKVKLEPWSDTADNNDRTQQMLIFQPLCLTELIFNEVKICRRTHQKQFLGIFN